MTQPEQVVVAAGVLVQDSRVLLGHRNRSRRWYPDVWDLPGGHVEQGESRRQALVRELREELGVQVTERDCTAVTTLNLTAGDGVSELRLSIWSVSRWSGTAANRAPEEHDRLGWFGADELPALTLAHADYAKLIAGILMRSAPLLRHPDPQPPARKRA